MKGCLDSATLWAMDGAELEGDELTAARNHARSCLMCETSRRELQQTQRILSFARSAPAPSLSWRSVDAAVDDAVTAAAAKSFRGRFSWQLLFAPSLAMALAALFFISRAEPSPKTLAPVAAAPVVTAPQEIASVEKEEPLLVKVKRRPTLISGPKTWKTPNGATARFSANARASVTGNSVELQQGDVLLRAKTGSDVRIGGAKLKPQGAAVLLASMQDVAVLEGAVLVERDDGSSLIIHAGESTSYRRGEVKKLLDAQRFAAFGVTVSAPTAASPDLRFIQRAQQSLKKGHCGDFLLGLETLAFDAEEPVVREQARIVKARCHDERLEPDKAAADYSRYLRDFPDGAAAAEAKAALK